MATFVSSVSLRLEIRWKSNQRDTEDTKKELKLRHYPEKAPIAQIGGRTDNCAAS